MVRTTRKKGVCVSKKVVLLVVLPPTLCWGHDVLGAQDLDETVLIPAATYMMGTDSSELAAIMEDVGVTRIDMLLPESPAREVRLQSFYLDRTDVTNAEFYEFVSDRPEWGRRGTDPALHNGRYLEHWRDNKPRDRDLARPVVFVTWYAAVAYCDWRGKRLPTEAEWEYAAGGGDRDRRYPWGSQPPTNDRVSWGDDGIDEPVPVASFPPNAFGLFDMAGNVWKYLADGWSPSHESEKLAQDALDPDTASVVTTRRVVRGGSWGASAANLRVRYRDSHRPFDAREMVGFRCAVTANGGSLLGR
jgi:sulfatase modifying factor 1